jgi:SAM-dependent methyltransferase
MLLNTPAAVQRIYENYRAQGASEAQRVGWNSRAVQQQNFDTVLGITLPLLEKHGHARVDDGWRKLSIHDAGCGTGDLLATLEARGGVGHYLGTDFFEPSLRDAQLRFPARGNVVFGMLDVLRSPMQLFPRADVTFCFGALAFHPPRHVETILHNLWNTSQFGLGFITWWDLPPHYVYAEHIEQLRKCVSRFLRESRAKEVVKRIGDYGDPTEAAFVLVK